MVNIAVIEDHAPSAELLEKYIRKFEDGGADVNDGLKITVFKNGGSFLNAVKSMYFDIVFMDIGLPDINGMTVAEELRKANASSVLVFVTDMAQFAVKGYKVDALDYIVKPVTYNNFSLVMSRALSRIDRRSEATLTVKTENGITRLPLSAITYVEVVNHKLIYHTRNGDVSCYGQLKDVSDLLFGAGFIQVSRYYIVNSKYVRSVEEYTVDVDGVPLQISVRKRREVMLKIAELFGE